MAHSVELLFDPATEARIRELWAALTEAGLAAPPQTARPHVTLTVAEHLDPGVDAALGEVAARLPLPARIGAPLLFGRSRLVLVRLIVPTAELLEVHAATDRLARPYLRPAPMPTAVPGRWTAHTTLARRVRPDRLAAALPIAARPAELAATFTGLRRWDGDRRVEFPVPS
ncbi:2'-5' RNA ligase family protein [Mycolicibacillus trivialis]|uniref:2'-5' RNA ligase n=2 Tax=Mycolicibacillus trivialis TaxID=1798 RepID=A0A1X2EPJ6_9MYCO|nr:2'-5' RNA ligase family protein [Mycolicibacillus trivialis]ORX08053.1 hypothetical protein AWC30_03850 [Mycolicibacillus trivialis]